jgi:DNA-binding CsgD family transcriptional regulator
MVDSQDGRIGRFGRNAYEVVGMKLTHMEERVVHQLCKGLLAKQIADKLGRSVRTIESHVATARERNEAKTTNQLCAMWTRELYKGE